jgi:hypothetical protein
MTFYEKLVAERGEAGAREYMREMQARRANPYHAFSDKELATKASRKGLAKRWGKDDTPDTSRPSTESEK